MADPPGRKQAYAHMCGVQFYSLAEVDSFAKAVAVIYNITVACHTCCYGSVENDAHRVSHGVVQFPPNAAPLCGLMNVP
jgi:hypothetical protein